MANLITDGFDWFPSGQSITERRRLWGAGGLYQGDTNGNGDNTTLVPDVRTGRFNFGKAMSWLHTANQNCDNGMLYPFGDGIQEGWIGFSFYRSSENTYWHMCGVGFADAAGSITSQPCQVFVHFGEGGVVNVFRGMPLADFSNRLGHSSAGAFEENQWFSVEMRAKIADSGGEVEVRINTVPVVQVVGADTQVTPVAQFDSAWLGEKVFGVFSAVKTDFAIDDLWVNDGTGTTNNTWMGNLRVKSMWMIADGANIDFTIGGTSPAATNWQSVQNNLLTDAKYVYSAVVGDYDLYVPDPNLNSPYVRVVQVTAGLRQDDATQRTAKMLIRLGTTVYTDDEEQFLNQTFTLYRGKWELNPATGVSFTGAEVNAMQAGLKVET